MLFKAYCDEVIQTSNAANAQVIVSFKSLITEMGRLVREQVDPIACYWRREMTHIVIAAALLLLFPFR